MWLLVKRVEQTTGTGATRHQSYCSFVGAKMIQISKFPSCTFPNKAAIEPSNDVIGPGLQVVCLQYVNISELFH